MNPLILLLAILFTLTLMLSAATFLLVLRVRDEVNRLRATVSTLQYRVDDTRVKCDDFSRTMSVAVASLTAKCTTLDANLLVKSAPKRAGWLRRLFGRRDR